MSKKRGYEKFKQNTIDEINDYVKEVSERVFYLNKEEKVNKTFTYLLGTQMEIFIEVVLQVCRSSYSDKTEEIEELLRNVVHFYQLDIETDFN